MFSRPVLYSLFALALFALFSAARQSFRAYKVFKSREEVQAELDRIASQKERIEKRLQSLESPVGLEKEAKERFNVKSPGEEVLVILEPKAGTSSEDEASSSGAFMNFFRKLFSL